MYTSAAKEYLVNMSDPKLLSESGLDLYKLQKTDFQLRKALRPVFPVLYKLLKEDKAEQISYSGGCVVIILKIHSDGAGSTEECIRNGGPNACGVYSMAGNSSHIEKDVPFKDGWRYQRPSFFAY